MVRRHPLSRKPRPRTPCPTLPGVWLFSDARLTTSLAGLAAILPPGSGIVVRHDALPPGARWRLLRRLVRTARVRRLMVLLAGPPALAQRWGADGVHLRQPLVHAAARARRLGLVVAMPVHGGGEARRARRARADIVYISPLHATRSHPGAPTLDRTGWLRLARIAGGRPIALGGMTPARARKLALASGGVHGWAAIDAWEEKAAKRRARQKRKAVPM